METIRDRFIIHMLTGLPPRAALTKTLAEASIHIEKHGSPSTLNSILIRLGLTDLVGKTVTEVLSILSSLINLTLTIVEAPGGVNDVPSPECIEANLPRGRPPTEDDIRRAWDLCVSRTSK